MSKSKKNLKIKNQIDGNNTEKEFEPTTFDELFGDAGLGKYRTRSEEAYENQIKEMNKTDLQSHAVSIGLIPIDNRIVLQQRLMREFKKHVAQLKKPKTKTFKADSKVIPEDILAIIKMGR